MAAPWSREGNAEVEAIGMPNARRAAPWAAIPVPCAGIKWIVVRYGTRRSMFARARRIDNWFAAGIPAEWDGQGGVPMMPMTPWGAIGRRAQRGG